MEPGSESQPPAPPREASDFTISPALFSSTALKSYFCRRYQAYAATPTAINKPGMPAPAIGAGAACTAPAYADSTKVTAQMAVKLATRMIFMTVRSPSLCHVEK